MPYLSEFFFREINFKPYRIPNFITIMIFTKVNNGMTLKTHHRIVYIKNGRCFELYRSRAVVNVRSWRSRVVEIMKECLV